MRATVAFVIAVFVLFGLFLAQAYTARRPTAPAAPAPVAAPTPAPMTINIFIPATPTPTPLPTQQPTATLVPTDAPTPGPGGLTWQLHIGSDGIRWGFEARNEAAPSLNSR